MEQAELARLVETRTTLVNLRTVLTNKMNDLVDNVVSAHGINLKKEAVSSDRTVEEIMNIGFGSEVSVDLKVVIQEIRHLNESIEELESKITEQSSNSDHRNKSENTPRREIISYLPLIGRRGTTNKSTFKVIKEALIKMRTTLFLWLLPSTQPFDLIRIYIVSALIGFFYLYLGSFAVESGSASYTDWAEALVKGATLNANFRYRDVGMPIVLVLSGFPFTHSLVGVVIIQFLMALAIPYLCYRAISAWFPRTAYYASLWCAFSLGPFLFFKTLHHDQPYVFFTILTLYFLNEYLVTQRPRYVYAMSFAVLASSLIRLLGKGTYPFLALICLSGTERRRRSYLHILASVGLFYLSTTAYTSYRERIMENPPAILGEQVFRNVYVFGNDFAVRLEPTFGPNVKLLLERMHDALQPNPVEAPLLKSGPNPPAYMQEFFYKYTTSELMEQMLAHPNFEYYYFIVEAARDDNLLLRASLETALARPTYIMRYFWRNSWEFLADPGWLHGRFTFAPQFQGGLLFPFGGITTAGRGTVGDRLPEPALLEAAFVPLARQPEIVRNLYAQVEMAWYRLYHPFTQVVLAGMLVAWFSMLVGVIERITGHLKWFSITLLSSRVLPASLGITVLLLLNISFTALLVESYYRYDYSLICLKVLLAGIGYTSLISFLRCVAFRYWTTDSVDTLRSRLSTWRSLYNQPTATWATRHFALTWTVLAVLTAGALFIWVAELRASIQPPGEGTIDIASASWGENCGAGKDNALQYVRSACSGQQKCNYVFDWRQLGNPAPNCVKQFEVAWMCGKAGPITTLALPSDPAQGTLVPIQCPTAK